MLRNNRDDSHHAHHDRHGVWVPAFAGTTDSDDWHETSRPFTRIDTWVFDLDNTLYPHHVNLWQQVDARIGEFVSAWLKVSAEEARVIQKDYYLAMAPPCAA